MPFAQFQLSDNSLVGLEFPLPQINQVNTFDKSGNTIPFSNYQVPLTNVVYLSTTGSDSNNGLTSATPKRTIWGNSGAYAAVPTGGTIVVRGGTYEEGFVGDTVNVPIRTKPCKIQAYPGEQPWFDGSTVASGWTKNGSVWTKSGFTFNAGNSSGFGTSDKPATTFYFDQLFINGAPQKRVATAPVAGQFSFDPATGVIALGSDPTGKEVRVSRYRGFAVFSAKIDLLGIGIRRYACGATAANKDISATKGYEAVYYGGSSAGTVIEKCAFVDNAMISLSISKAQFTVNQNLFVRAGKSHAQIGGSTGCDGLKFTKNYCYIGNLGNFPAEPTSGGVKIVKMDSGTVTDNVFEDQQNSYLLWFDQTCTRSVIARNTCISTPGRKSKTGILWEISGGGLLPTTGTRKQYWSYIVNNKMLGTYSYAGLTIMDSNWTKIWNNYVEAGDTSCYMIRQDNRPTGLAETAPGTYNYGAVDFLVHDLEFVNNDIGPANTYAQFIAYNSNGIHLPTADTMFQRIDGNWWKTPSPKPQIQWGTTNQDGSRITITQAQLDARTGGKNYSGPTAPTTRVPIPSDVAAYM